MKRLFALITVFIICFCFWNIADAHFETVNYVLNSDIVAYINNMPIKSYNINGYTGIVAEDLINYGFNVVYYDEHRLLSISYVPNGRAEITANYVPEKVTSPIGSVASRVYKTDIKTSINGEYVQGFNIGGRTVILIDELNRLGDVVWYSEERKICYNDVISWEISLHETDYGADVSGKINFFVLNLLQDENGNIFTRGENINYLDYIKMRYSKEDGLVLSFSVYQRVLPAANELIDLLGNMITVRYDGELIQNNADYANNRMSISINGEDVSITKVSQGKGNGHLDYYFYLNKDIRNLSDIKTLKMQCK